MATPPADITNIVNEINDKITDIQSLIETRNTNENVDIRGNMDELKALLEIYKETNPTETSVGLNDINFALSKQSMTIEEREELLNTKIRQIEMATKRNDRTKNMLTIFIIINIAVLLIFIGLIIVKSKK